MNFKKLFYEIGVFTLYYFAVIGFGTFTNVVSWFLWIRGSMAAHDPTKLNTKFSIDVFMANQLHSGILTQALFVAGVFYFFMRVYLPKRNKSKRTLNPFVGSSMFLNEQLKKVERLDDAISSEPILQISDVDFDRIKWRLEKFANERLKAAASGAESTRLSALLLENYAIGMSEAISEIDKSRSFIDLANTLCQQIDPDYETNRAARAADNKSK